MTNEPDPLDQLPVDEQEQLAAEAAMAVNDALGKLFLRLGPPPGPASEPPESEIDPR